MGDCIGKTNKVSPDDEGIESEEKRPSLIEEVQVKVNII